MTISKSSFLGYVNYTGWLLQVLAEKPICSRIRTMASAQFL